MFRASTQHLCPASARAGSLGWSAPPMPTDQVRLARWLRRLSRAAASALDELGPTHPVGKNAGPPREWFKFPPI